MWYSIHQGHISANEMSGGVVEDGVYVVLVYASIILNTYIGISKQVINVFFPFLLYNFESLISTQ